MKSTVGAIFFIGIVLTVPVVIALIAVTASKNGSAQPNVDPQGQSSYERITNPWADDYHGGRFHPPNEG